MKIASLLIGVALSFSALASRVEFEISGMVCGMCEEAITKELKATQKVENISVNSKEKKASLTEITGKKISDSEIKAAVKKAGDKYEVSKIRRRQ